LFVPVGMALYWQEARLPMPETEAEGRG